jgi:endogenous inhibitor of DNA gyrase (YacG/DUF329 family)
MRRAAIVGRGINFLMSICPICGAEVAPRSENKAFPFCSARCKSIDLGKWLSEEYRVPAAPDEGGEGGDEQPEGDSPSKTDVRH